MAPAPTTTESATLRRDLDWLAAMQRIRHFEERVEQLFSDGRLGGTTHPSIGQEAVAVGACAALEAGDYTVSTHRGHGHFLARGAEPGRMFAELMGKATGYCGGKGGSQHMSAAELGFLGTNGVTGGGLPMATGAALSLKVRGVTGVSLAFFGDGATNQGTFHECLNMAALWRLPAVYVCENNLYAMSVPLAESTAVPDLASRAVAYGMRSRRVDGMDPEAVYDEVAEAVGLARAGGGPSMIEALTYRHLGHSKSDRRVYRAADEEQYWIERDPVTRWCGRLRAAGVSQDRLDELSAYEREEIERAVASATSAPDPDPAAATEGVYA